MSQTPNNSSPQPASWSLWRPDNGIVFVGASGTSASAPATPNATPRTVPQPAVAALSPSQRSPWPQLPPASYSAPTIKFVPKRAMHNMAQKADEKPLDDPVEKLAENITDDKQTKEEEKTGAEEPKEILHPVTTLDYKVPDDLFRAARDAPEGTPESYWLYTMYRKPAPATDKTDKEGNPATATTVKVHYCKSKHTTERVCRDYFQGEPLLGFDLEWMPNATRWQGARRNVCLVQIASPGRIGLFHLSLYPKSKGGDKDSELVGPVLRSILEDASSIKAGVAIKGDATRVQKYLGVTMRGMFELSHLHKLVVHSQSGETHLINKKLISLAVQVQEHLRLPLFKGQDVRSSDWSRPLSMDQIIYSASDAYAAVQLFSALDLRRENLDPKPPRPAFVEQNLPIKLADGVVAAATVGEAADEADEDVEDNGATPAKKMPPEYLARAEKTIEIEAEGETDAGPATPAKAHTPKPRTPTPRTPQTLKAPATLKDARITAAEEWLRRFRETATSSGRTLRAKPASLRAYHLWHGDETLNPVALAALLRDPPLQTSTVVTYVLDAVQLESLPYVKTRMRAELLDRMPEDLRRRKYAYLSKVCGYTIAAQGR
ncbi:hypothetical protein SEUCBS140593_003685 [Sporothrix eucalyptigena]|uniref:3'-5' exonuclease domain-containing protein n=1 Tax=Sporothrix eucalyptigena TaxID=1812306 RepID=A0ABP0BGW2_9PEZI